MNVHNRKQTLRNIIMYNVYKAVYMKLNEKDLYQRNEKLNMSCVIEKPNKAQ